MDKTLHGLEQDGIISVTRHTGGSVEFVGLSDKERELGRENYDFYCFLIWPFIESAWLGAVSLMGLTPPLDVEGDPWLDFRKVQDHAQLLGKTLYQQGDLSYFEAVNKETLKNAFQRFEEEGVLLVAKSKESKVPPTTKLSPSWRPNRDRSTGSLTPGGKLWDFTEMIALSRREGYVKPLRLRPAQFIDSQCSKNRRDGATVSTRVLRLADRVGKDLFATATVELNTRSADMVVSEPKPRRTALQSRL